MAEIKYTVFQQHKAKLIYNYTLDKVAYDAYTAEEDKDLIITDEINGKKVYFLENHYETDEKIYNPCGDDDVQIGILPQEAIKNILTQVIKNDRSKFADKLDVHD
jgi:hypothetical protein